MTQVYVGSADGSVSVEPGCRHREARAKYRRAARSETTPAGAPRYVVNVRGWSGLDGWRPPSPPRPFHDRLWQCNGLYLFAAAVVSGVQEAFALGGALLAAARRSSKERSSCRTTSKTGTRPDWKRSGSGRRTIRSRRRSARGRGRCSRFPFLRSEGEHRLWLPRIRSERLHRTDIRAWR